MEIENEEDITYQVIRTNNSLHDDFDLLQFSSDEGEHSNVFAKIDDSLMDYDDETSDNSHFSKDKDDRGNVMLVDYDDESSTDSNDDGEQKKELAGSISTTNDSFDREEQENELVGSQDLFPDSDSTVHNSSDERG